MFFFSFGSHLFLVIASIVTMQYLSMIENLFYGLFSGSIEATG